MKKVVVVTEKENVTFEGESLKVINRGPTNVTASIDPILIVKDGAEEIAVFQKWDYWKKLE